MELVVLLLPAKEFYLILIQHWTLYLSNQSKPLISLYHQTTTSFNNHYKNTCTPHTPKPPSINPQQHLNPRRPRLILPALLHQTLLINPTYTQALHLHIDRLITRVMGNIIHCRSMRGQVLRSGPRVPGVARRRRRSLRVRETLRQTAPARLRQRRQGLRQSLRATSGRLQSRHAALGQPADAMSPQRYED